MVSRLHQEIEKTLRRFIGARLLIHHEVYTKGIMVTTQAPLQAEHIPVLVSIPSRRHYRRELNYPPYHVQKTLFIPRDTSQLHAILHKFGKQIADEYIQSMTSS